MQQQQLPALINLSINSTAKWGKSAVDFFAVSRFYITYIIQLTNLEIAYVILTLTNIILQYYKVALVEMNNIKYRIDAIEHILRFVFDRRMYALGRQ